MKSYIRLPLLIVVFTVFSLLLLFHLTQGTNDKSVSQISIPQLSIPQNQVVSKVYPGLPVRLLIPAININAAVQHVGVDTRGDMEVPSNAVDVGWFKLGSRPGEKGSAVISGHIDGENGKAGVFTDLGKLKKGDKLYIVDDRGTTNIFIVRESRIYNPGYAEEVFNLNDSAHLNLVTCDGVWDGVKKTYSKRLVVLTNIVN